MRKITLLTTVFILLALVSCRKDDVFTEVDPPNFPGPDVNLVTSFTGLVVDEEGQAIQNALVTDENGNTHETDENGFFQAAQSTYSQGGSFFTVQKQGYIQSFRFVGLQAGVSGFSKVVLVKQNRVASFDTGVGEEITIHSSGATLKIDANSIVQENGAAYSGQVDVFAHWYDPQSLATASTMPGDLRAIDSENNAVVLETYGMVSVELVGANGEELNLKENTTADLEFPIVESQRAIAPEEIPLWSMDEATGYWKEEGQASRDGNVYKAQVSHFSFWNCDYPYPLVEISGTLKDQDGNVLSNVPILITVLNGGQCGTGTTDNRGYFQGLVPKDELMLISVYSDVCFQSAYEYEIGPFEEDTNVGMVLLEFTGEGVLNFSGTLKGCQGEVVANGNVIIRDEVNNIHAVVQTLSDGTYSGQLLHCNSLSAYSFQGFDTETLKESQVVLWETTNEENLVVEDLLTCEETDTYFIMTVNGESTTYTDDLLTIIIEDYYLIRYGDITSNFTQISIDTLDFELRNLTSQVSNLDGGCVPGTCENPMVNITQKPTMIGDYLEGEASTSLEIAGVNYDVEYRFRVPITADTYILSILEWTDLNEDGVYPQDMSEPRTFNLNFSATDGTTEYAEISRGVFYVSKEANVTVTAETTTTAFTVLNTDSTVLGNDFNSDGVAENIQLDNSRVLFCGIQPPPFICTTLSSGLCGSACTTIIMDGGLPPYNIIIDGLAIAPTTANNYTFCDAAGNYAYTVTDANGDECSGSFVNEEPVDDLAINNQGIIYECANGEVLATLVAEVIGGTLPYSFNWSNGVNEDILEDVVPGVYTLWVEDANGCQVFTDFFVEASYLKVKGKVWDDNEGSIPNEQEAESGIGGITIQLLDVADNVVASTITAADNGLYVLEVPGIFGGDYRMEIIVPSQYELVEKDSANSDELDSDADPLNGRTDIFTVEVCNEFDFDFGMK